MRRLSVQVIDDDEVGEIGGHFLMDGKARFAAVPLDVYYLGLIADVDNNIAKEQG